MSATKEGQQQQIHKVAILGASGNVGKATVDYFRSHPSKDVHVTAFVRNPNNPKANDLQPSENISIEQGDMSDEQGTAQNLKGFDVVFIITPGTEKRVDITQSAIQAAKQAQVRHILVISVPTIRKIDQVFGRQCAAIEEATRKSGVHYTLLRLPLFMDNNFAHADSIKSQGKIYAPIDPDVPYVSIAVADVGEACAKILAHPRGHEENVYTFISAPFTQKDLASAFGEALKKDVQYVRVDYDAAKKAFMEQVGMPEWQTDGVMELFKNIDNRDPVVNPQETGDFKRVTGRDPMTIQQWVQSSVNAFV